MRATSSVARVQLTEQKQAKGGSCCGPPSGGVLWYSLSSLGTYSILEGDVLD